MSIKDLTLEQINKYLDFDLSEDELDNYINEGQINFMEAIYQILRLRHRQFLQLSWKESNSSNHLTSFYNAFGDFFCVDLDEELEKPYDLEKEYKVKRYKTLPEFRYWIGDLTLNTARKLYQKGFEDSKEEALVSAFQMRYGSAYYAHQIKYW